MDMPASRSRSAALAGLTASAAARPLTRRAVLAAAAASAGVVLGAHGAVAAAPRRAVPAPGTVALPVGFRPEGITSGPGTRFYVGSVASGRILTGDLLTGEFTELLPAAAGRSLRGLRWDARSGYVWAVGSQGGGVVWAVDAATGAVVSATPVPGAAFLNDLDVTADAVWVTDSRVNRLTRIAAPGGAPTGGPATFLDLVGDWPIVSGFSANGLRALPDGSLVLNNTTAGGLWRVPLPSGAVEPIPVSGGPGIIGGDGLELDGPILYNVRGAGADSVAVVILTHDGGWSANWAGNRRDETLDVPSTATVAGGWLWAVNARFGVQPDPDTAEYWITRLPAR
ncbi:hypothetical protein [Sinomonas mesophila]|uniref:hypothetical protein n=1 Tax=Sinomonas mesophila TaxID=1531955 RepID=UPI000985DAE7|nr:hypothetical protein [Sinomonas mesophila]